MSQPTPPTIEDAIILAAQAHKGQVDKQGQPYILHPLYLMTKFTQPVTQMVAVLHDVVEDTDVTLDQLIGLGYPVAVIDALRAITREKEDETYEEYIKRVATNEIAKMVKIEDLRHNLSRMDSLPYDVTVGLRKRYSNALKQLGAWASQRMDE